MFKMIKNISLIALVMFLAWFGLVQHDFIELKTAKGEHILLVPIAQGKKFCVRFTHSVALTPVDECFVVENNDIVLKSTVYHDFGAGLPHELGDGQEMVFEDGKIKISGFSLHIPSLQVRVGRIAKHRLLLPHIFTDKVHEIYLESFVQPGGVVVLTAKKSSMLQAFMENWSILHVKL